MKTFEYRYKNDMKIKKNVVGLNEKGYLCLSVLFLTILNESIIFLVQYNITIKKLKNSLLSKKSNLDLSLLKWPVCKSKD